MAQLGFTKPNNDVIQGEPPFTEYLKVETATEMNPGRLVKKGTTDYDVVVVAAAIDRSIGWLGYGKAHASFKPTNRDTAYAANDEVPVHVGSGFRVRATLITGNNVVKGARLVPAANGKLAAAIAMEVVVPSGAVAVTSSAAQPTLTKTGSDMPGGPIVAIADESVNASGSDLPIWVQSLR